MVRAEATSFLALVYLKNVKKEEKITNKPDVNSTETQKPR
jgi:hypothetical protein